MTSLLRCAHESIKELAASVLANIVTSEAARDLLVRHDGVKALQEMTFGEAQEEFLPEYQAARDAALAKMLAMQQGAPSERVWPWVEDREFLSIYGSLRVLCRTAGVPYHPFHSIRKSTASYLKKAGVSAKKQLGHSSEEMAETHYYDEEITGRESNLDYLPDITQRPADRPDAGPGKPR
jgi:hypothetical protein